MMNGRWSISREHWSWSNQGILSAVARQRGFVVKPKRTGITVQFPLSPGPWCIYPFVSLRVKVESTRASHFALSSLCTLQTRLLFSPVGGGMQK